MPAAANDTGLAPETLAELRTLAEASPEREICGLIGRDPEGRCQVYPVANTASRPRTRFLLDAHGQIEAMRHMRSRGQELHAIYHSHPRGPARPSARDRALAAYPGVLYLIIAPRAGAVPEIGAYSYDGKDFRLLEDID